jgi:hypothetical protein
MVRRGVGIGLINKKITLDWLIIETALKIKFTNIK